MGPVAGVDSSALVEPLLCGVGLGNWPFKAEKTEHDGFKAEEMDTGADLVIAGCCNCRDQIMKNPKIKYNLDIEVKYLWEMVADALILEK